jgi:hypothetical protein
MGSLRIGADGIAAMPGLRGDEPNVPFFCQSAGRGNLLTTAFPLKQFLLFMFPNGRGQAGLLDGDPEKRHTFYRASQPQSWWTLRGVLGLGLAGVLSASEAMIFL